MQLVKRRFKIAVPIEKHFEVVKPVYDQNANNVVSAYQRFISNYYCKGDVVYSLMESTVRYLWELSLADNVCSNSDGKRVLSKLKNIEDFEIRSMMDGSCWGPSTSTGKGREPKVEDSREKWEQHAILVLNKIKTIDSFIIGDIAYPPYWFIYEIPRMSILYLYENGDLRWDLNDHRDGLIKNRISRTQFYKLFFKNNYSNPYSLSWEGKEANPFNLTDEDIEKSKKMLGYRCDQASWIKIKEQDKKLEREEEPVRVFDSFITVR